MVGPEVRDCDLDGDVDRPALSDGGRFIESRASAFTPDVREVQVVDVDRQLWWWMRFQVCWPFWSMTRGRNSRSTISSRSASDGV